MSGFLLDTSERLETERLYLRCYKAGDGPMYYAASLRNQHHLTEFESDNVLMHLRDEEHAERIVRKMAADWRTRTCFCIGVFDRATDEWCGQVYVEPTIGDLAEFSIGCVADADHEGRGYITEAVNAVLRVLFGEMGAHRVKAECSKNNTRSWRLLERCGFRREGHLQEKRTDADDLSRGDYLYGLLRRDYVDR